VRCCNDIEEVIPSLIGGLDIPRSIQIGILVIVSRLIDDNNDSYSNNNNNNNNNNMATLREKQKVQ
jgi:hypothetical protein